MAIITKHISKENIASLTKRAEDIESVISFAHHETVEVYISYDEASELFNIGDNVLDIEYATGNYEEELDSLLEQLFAYLTGYYTAKEKFSKAA